MPKVFLSLGSNLGDRAANVERAMSELDAALGRHLKVSEIIETEAIGFDGGKFLNCVACYSTRKWPETLLKLCKDIEYRMGRREVVEYAADGSRIYHNRIIDIDILLYGKRRISTPALTVPHPQIETRPFVKELLEQAL